MTHSTCLYNLFEFAAAWDVLFMVDPRNIRGWLEIVLLRLLICACNTDAEKLHFHVISIPSVCCGFNVPKLDSKAYISIATPSQVLQLMQPSSLVSLSLPSAHHMEASCPCCPSQSHPFLGLPHLGIFHTFFCLSLQPLFVCLLVCNFVFLPWAYTSVFLFVCFLLVYLTRVILISLLPPPSKPWD